MLKLDQKDIKSWNNKANNILKSLGKYELALEWYFNYIAIKDFFDKFNEYSHMRKLKDYIKEKS